MIVNGKIVFTGSGNHQVDIKGRVSVPSEYRRDLGEESCVLVRNGNEYLSVFPYSSYQRIMTTLMDFSDNFTNEAMLDPDFLTLLEHYTAKVEVSRIDDHYRLQIPVWLREYIGLDKTAFVRGFGNVFEIWPEDKWMSSDKSVEKDCALAKANLTRKYGKKKEDAPHEA